MQLKITKMGQSHGSKVLCLISAQNALAYVTRHGHPANFAKK
jgi:predicted alpha/beta hydrolase